MFCNTWRKTESFLLYTVKRYGNGKNHWSVLKQKNHPIDKAREHFDDFYGSAFGSQWDPIREALLRRHKYVALINNYGDDKITIEALEKSGAYNMRNLFEAHKRFLENCGEPETESATGPMTHGNSHDQIKAYAAQVSRSELAGLYEGTDSLEVPQMLDTGGAVLGRNPLLDEVPAESVEIQGMMRASLGASLENPVIDESRLVQPEMGMTSAALWTFIPSTRLMGKDDWLPESHQYKYYTDASDFPLTIEEDDVFEFPERLNVYAFDGDDTTNFIGPRAGDTGVFNYYLMDGASILSVLALGVEPGDRVLDMCAAPGGKSLAILQTMLPDLLVANDSSYSRTRRIEKVFKEYLYDYSSCDKWSERVQITQADAKLFTDAQGFDKVLVDVPCTTDRISIKENDNNLFKPSRNKERLKLPELQASILCNALSVCRVGGTVVYSTCALSPIQNDGVIHLALKQAFEEKGIRATIKLFGKSISGIRSLFSIGEGLTASRYGYLITPQLNANYGPAYFAKLVRTH